MTALPPDPAGTGLVSSADELARLERRWRRERDARLESEHIAEAGLRRLWEAARELDARVEERTAELVEARRAAEAADRAKSAFLANLGHDLRTPLQTIVAAVELARPSSAEEQERLAQARAAALELRDLVSGLLDLAATEAGPAPERTVPTDLVELVDDLSAAWGPRLLAAGLLLVPEAAGHALIDATVLRRIAVALLDNTTRHVGRGTVTLRCTAGDGEVELAVADHGSGIAEDAIDRAFEAFVQLEGPTGRNRPGAGVGLALVRRWSEAIGGTATASTTPGGGLTVTVRVPDRGATPTVPAPTPVPGP